MSNPDLKRLRSLGSALKEIWTGKASKSTHARYFLVALIIYIVGIVAGMALFPGGFDFMTVYVSYLGGDPNNPIGRFPYNATVLIAGILLIPHFIYLYRRLTPAVKILTFLSCLCGIVGAAGFASLAIFYQGLNADLHQISTDTAYYSLGASAIIMLFSFIRKAVMTRTWPKWWHIVLMYVQAIGMIGATFLLYPWFGDHLSEWLYTAAFMLWLLETVIIVPADAAIAGV
ncbi:MAG TPA: hypothetical protein VKM55_16005 [Candidatus Lokiarchaeia archaeon]|nr:hypothetical protein [Candidatus Lokiarchaeia archaeon]